MGFGSKQILAARTLDGSDFLNNVTSSKIDELEKEVTNLIESYLNITAPEEPILAPPILRGIWADIAYFKSIKWQKNISDEEIKRRTILKDDAFKLLDKIKSGQITPNDSENSLTKNSSPSPIKVTGKKRIKTL